MQMAACLNVQLLNSLRYDRHVSRDGTKFCGTGFQPVKKHGQEGRAPLLDTKLRTVPFRSVGADAWSHGCRCRQRSWFRCQHGGSNRVWLAKLGCGRGGTTIWDAKTP
jgi:hypothetical protein